MLVMTAETSVMPVGWVKARAATQQPRVVHANFGSCVVLKVRLSYGLTQPIRCFATPTNRPPLSSRASCPGPMVLRVAAQEAARGASSVHRANRAARCTLEPGHEAQDDSSGRGLPSAKAKNAGGRHP